MEEARVIKTEAKPKLKLKLKKNNRKYINSKLSFVNVKKPYHLFCNNVNYHYDISKSIQEDTKITAKTFKTFTQNYWKARVKGHNSLNSECNITQLTSEKISTSNIYSIPKLGN